MPNKLQRKLLSFCYTLLLRFLPLKIKKSQIFLLIMYDFFLYKSLRRQRIAFFELNHAKIFLFTTQYLVVF